MNLINLKINRIIIHEIHQRNEGGEKVPPTRSTDLIEFDEDAMQTFRTRFIDAVGDNSKAVTMSIIEQGENKLPSIIDELRKANDDEFIDSSFVIADRLADAQTTRSIRGGIIVIFDGTYGVKSNSFVGVMKAEVYSAYKKTHHKLTKKIGLEYVKEALLTPTSKLYKTAGYFHNGEAKKNDDLNSCWDVLVSDSQISHTDGKAAAKYFYDAFLGCGYPETSARTTKLFYDVTHKFINNMNIPEEEKSTIHTALSIYLKEKTDIVDPSEFAERHFDIETQDLYTETLIDNDLPSTSFTKDIQYISNKLKQRKLSFASNVKITAPASVFNDLIEIEPLNEYNGELVNWTQVTIKDKIVSQE